MKSLFIKAKQTRRGFTIVEVVIAMTVCSMILVFAAFVVNATAKNIRKMTNDGEGTRDISVALEFLRYTLTMADYTTVSISNENHRIDFQDPNKSGITSAFEFRDNHLWYDEDTSDMEDDKRIARAINVTFTPVSAGTVMRVYLLSRGRVGEVVAENIETTCDIYLRNT
ncbi:prepilin-type N-terminal cleavage/methylation domain-containing protein [Candidatus Sumerlaeota bacterium]|nr:prepilin-type N-terminal cleavage/methylation domain-containing protein [Candidatus Sumerlaeota bacterium]